MVEAKGRWGREQSTHRVRAGALPKDSYLVWITAKGGNIVMHPLQGRNLISDSQVTRGLRTGDGWRVLKQSKYTQTVV